MEVEIFPYLSIPLNGFYRPKAAREEANEDVSFNSIEWIPASSSYAYTVAR